MEMLTRERTAHYIFALSLTEVGAQTARENRLRRWRRQAMSVLPQLEMERAFVR